MYSYTVLSATLLFGSTSFAAIAPPAAETSSTLPLRYTGTDGEGWYSEAYGESANAEAKHPAKPIPLAKIYQDEKSLLTSAVKDPQYQSLEAWLSTETAVPTTEMLRQQISYLNAQIHPSAVSTGASTQSIPLPAFVTAMPSALQGIARKFLEQEGAIYREDEQASPHIHKHENGSHTAHHATYTHSHAHHGGNSTTHHHHHHHSHTASGTTLATAASGNVVGSPASPTNAGNLPNGAPVAGGNPSPAQLGTNNNSTAPSGPSSNTTAATGPTVSIQPKGGAAHVGISLTTLLAVALAAVVWL